MYKFTKCHPFSHKISVTLTRISLTMYNNKRKFHSQPYIYIYTLSSMLYKWINYLLFYLLCIFLSYFLYFFRVWIQSINFCQYTNHSLPQIQILESNKIVGEINLKLKCIHKWEDDSLPPPQPSFYYSAKMNRKLNIIIKFRKLV